MSKQELIDQLILLQSCHDEEIAHIEADKLLLQFINDYKVAIEFDKINKWYA